MDDETDDGRPAGWVLLSSSAAMDLDGAWERFGQVHRVPVPADTDLDAILPGTPCFLVRTDRNRVVGLWAVGEVVAPPLALPAGTPVLPAEAPLGAIDPSVPRTYAEVELLALAKAVPLTTLVEDARLARSPLGGRRPAIELGSDPGTPIALPSSAVRALEALEWWIEEPTDEQRRALDRLLAEEDPLLDALEAGEG